MPGQNSAKVIFMTREALFWNPRRWSAAVVVAGSTAVLVGMTISTDVGKWVHTLPSHPKLDEHQGFCLYWNAYKEQKHIILLP